MSKSQTCLKSSPREVTRPTVGQLLLEVAGPFTRPGGKIHYGLRSLFAAIALVCSCTLGGVAAPPGVIVDQSPDFQQVYVGCPAIALLPDGS